MQYMNLPLLTTNRINKYFSPFFHKYQSTETYSAFYQFLFDTTFLILHMKRNLIHFLLFNKIETEKTPDEQTMKQTKKEEGNLNDVFPTRRK